MFEIPIKSIFGIPIEHGEQTKFVFNMKAYYYIQTLDDRDSKELIDAVRQLILVFRAQGINLLE